jgi:hypothetical protein
MYSNPKVPTEWYLKNKSAIEKLNCWYELKQWLNEISTERFAKWFKQIMIDFNGDENGNGVVREFRDYVIAEAAVAAYKGKKEFKGCCFYA